MCIRDRYYSIEHETYVDNETAKSIEKDKLIKREIKIEGWVGIQRYLDKTHYGINVIRNGRIILNLEKEHFFRWWNPDDIDEDKIKETTKYWRDNYLEEYPIDNVLGGRIVGEINADFILPKYTNLFFFS